jgi:three-Cys-motif partner protein
MANEFFTQQQPAAVLKHELLERYLRIFIQKTGSTAPDGKVALLDGYAGPGTYGDGTAGSPAIAARVAEIVATANRNAVGHLVEEDPDSFAALEAFVTATAPTWHVYSGRVEEHLDLILDRTKGLPLFAFLDPFGLGIPFDTLRDRLLKRSPLRVGNRNREATEVLLNFSVHGLRRNAGHLESAKDYPARDTFIAKMDAALGGEWWRDLWRAGPGTDRVLKILAGYEQRLAASPGGWSCWSIPVSDRWQAPPDYYLVHLTQHADGIWLFHESVSNALEPYRQHCLNDSGQMDLEPLEVREPQWIDCIKANVRSRLEQGEFTVGDAMRDVYGDTLGHAREKHVRAAVKALHAEGATDCNGKGDVRTLRITRPANPTRPASPRLF